jgi:hypothetical protein
VVQDRVNPPQKAAAEGRKAVRDQIVQVMAFVDALDLDAPPRRLAMCGMGIVTRMSGSRVSGVGVIAHQT